MTTKAVFCRLIFFVNLEIDHSSTFSKKYILGLESLKKKFSLTETVEIVHKISYIEKKQIYKKALEIKDEDNK